MLDFDTQILPLNYTLEKLQTKDCQIEIFGLGYVGFPLAVRLASAGFMIIGVDINSNRLDRLVKNSLMESELNLKNEFLHSREIGNISFSKNSIKSNKPKISIICVPTPISTNQVQSDTFVKSAIEDCLSNCKEGDVIIIESSIEVGTTEKMIKLIESKGFKIGNNVGLCFCPERIDPQNKKWNLENIPRVIYCSDQVSYQIAQKIYSHINNANLIRVNSPKIAEVVKSFENAFRLVNISLVNELAVLCDKLKISVNDVIKAAATKPFGFMPFYPSAGAGGHCIPKDPLFLLESAKKFGVDFSIIKTAIIVNSIIPKYIVDSIQTGIEELKLSKSILVIGLTYKPDVEDMRDSPGFKIVKELLARNFTVTIFDPFYKKELEDKYSKENELSNINFEHLDSISDDKMIVKFDSICIVQHHSKLKMRLKQVYDNSLVQYIFDCRAELIKNPKSKTVLNTFGA